MIFYRLVICRLIKYLGLDEIDKEKERLDILMKRNKKPIYRPKLHLDENKKKTVFLILAVVNLLLMLTLPLKMLDNPCEVFKKHMPNFYEFTATVKSHETMLDGIMYLSFIALVYLASKTVLDAIAVSEVNKSPWLAEGKYELPKTGRSEFENYIKERDRAVAIYERRLLKQIYAKKCKKESDYDKDNDRYYYKSEKEYEAINHKYNQIRIESYGIMIDRIFDSDFDKFK